MPVHWPLPIRALSPEKFGAPLHASRPLQHTGLRVKLRLNIVREYIPFMTLD